MYFIRFGGRGGEVIGDRLRAKRKVFVRDKETVNP